MHRPILFSVWVCVILGGFCALTSYEQTPGESGNPQLNWPDGLEVTEDSKRPTLIMFAHPHCPCTSASVNELALLLAKCDGRISAYVLLVRPEGVGSDWVETDLKQQAESIPGVVVLEDEDGRFAQRLGIRTSGETVVYEKGKLRFCGGITASRGHSGDNIGRQAIVSLVLHGKPMQPTAPVFGCPLLNQPSEIEPAQTEPPQTEPS